MVLSLVHKAQSLLQRLNRLNSHNLKTEGRSKKCLGPFLFGYNRERNTVSHSNQRLTTLLYGGGRWDNLCGFIFMGQCYETIWVHLTWKLLSLQANWRNVPVGFNSWLGRSRNSRRRWRSSVSWSVGTNSWSQWSTIWWFGCLYRRNRYSSSNLRPRRFEKFIIFSKFLHLLS
jgi:hypothetical protein